LQWVETNLRRDKTARHEITALWGEEKVELRETKRAVTPWEWLVVFVQLLRKAELVEAVGKHLPFALTSPNAIDLVQTFGAFLASVLTGARRLGAVASSGRTLAANQDATARCLTRPTESRHYSLDGWR
jgi:hypothetical protein